MAGDRAEHANLFYELVEGLPHLQYYLLNTGGIGAGEEYRQIRLEHTLAILDSLLRGGLEDWVDSPSGFKVPAAVRAVDDIYFHPELLYSGNRFEVQQKELNRLRHETIEQVGRALHRRIRNVF